MVEMAKPKEDLRRHLARLDGRGYRAYKEIAGTYDLETFRLSIDHVQGDPFASPSRVSVKVRGAVADFPGDLLARRCRRIALQDYLTRRFAKAIRAVIRPGRESNPGGTVRIDAGGQEVIERTAMHADREGIEARFTVGLPAAGRLILGGRAQEILLAQIPEIVSRSLLFSSTDEKDLRQFIETIEAQESLREQLQAHGLICFLADGSLLPRRSGIDDRSLSPTEGETAIPWRSPGSLGCSLDLPNGGQVPGTGIPPGVTLIVGGGFHGKSTLLHAIERGVYNHIPADGRERVVTVAGAIKIRAEDGRRIEKVNIHPFISNLPFGRDTVRFSTENASGSTSQAANIVEAIEAGATLLLIDEDTSATNFMIRDGRMQQLVAKSKEPITPFIDRVGQLFREHGVSTILVMGGSGDYFDVADRVILMESYLPSEVSGDARKIAGRIPTARVPEGKERFGPLAGRRPLASSFDARRGRRDVKIDARGLRTILFGKTTLDLSALEQLVDPSQTRAIGAAIHFLTQHDYTDSRTLREGIDRLAERLEREGLDLLDPRRVGNLAMPRPLEVAAAINRLRTLRVA